MSYNANWKLGLIRRIQYYKKELYSLIIWLCSLQSLDISVCTPIFLCSSLWLWNNEWCIIHCSALWLNQYSVFVGKPHSVVSFLFLASHVKTNHHPTFSCFWRPYDDMSLDQSQTSQLIDITHEPMYKSNKNKSDYYLSQCSNCFQLLI